MTDGELFEILAIPRERLGEGTGVRVRVVGDMADLARQMADDMAAHLCRQNEAGQPTRWIIPVGPVDQFPILAERCNRERISLRRAWLLNMDEYLTDNDRWVAADHPLSFRAYMDRKFYDLLDPELAPPLEQRIFPDPQAPERIATLIEAMGGVDICFGGIGINGHIAFNEPPEPGESLDIDEFASLPTRCLSLSRETRTINAVTVGGEIGAIPRRAVTIGMREILAARAIRLYCNRPWQKGIVRRLLHGPITPLVPASLVRRHPDVTLTVADYVAEPPDIRLR